MNTPGESDHLKITDWELEIFLRFGGIIGCTVALERIHSHSLSLLLSDLPFVAAPAATEAWQISNFLHHSLTLSCNPPAASLFQPGKKFCSFQTTCMYIHIRNERKRKSCLSMCTSGAAVELNGRRGKGEVALLVSPAFTDDSTTILLCELNTCGNQSRTGIR